jgi:hypothetical protein
MKYLHVCLVALAACNASVDSGSTTQSGSHGSGGGGGGGGSLPVDEIEAIVGADGHVDNGVLAIEIERTDIGDVRGPLGTTLTPSFGIHGELNFQPLGNGKAILNGDLALKEDEVNPFIAALLQNDLEWQAFHQHVPTDPDVWFVHFRGVCDPVSLAHSIRAAIDVTGTPLPQKMPANPTTPLDAQRLADILHGSAEVGDEGVVSVTVPRSHGVKLAGVPLEPDTGIANVIEFKPTGGDNADVLPDFAMEADEIRPVVETMLLELQWFQGCLYNQETAEHPQLYFDHMLKRGDAYALAQEIRRGLDRTDAK